jgi:LuxR family maltose regulon positive regulatory protein
VILALRALALVALGRAGEAENELQHALELAQPRGFIRVFIDLGSQIQAILNRLEGLSSNDAYIRRILSTLMDEQRKRNIDHGSMLAITGTAQNLSTLAEPLTAREMDVLRLLREPISNKEIASQLYLSPSTVKRHTINLYGKLGVHSRREAVAAAIGLGLLPSS